MKKQGYLGGILVRYGVLLAAALIFSCSSLIQTVLLKLTIYPVNFLLGFFYDSIVYGNKILAESISIEIIPACVAVSAYLLLIILNLTTAMTARERAKSLIFSLLLLLALNILRVFALSALLIQNFAYFEELHKFLWYFLSIILVAGIWFYTAYLFKIKNIPVYDDFKYLLASLNKRNKKEK